MCLLWARFCCGPVASSHACWSVHSVVEMQAGSHVQRSIATSAGRSSEVARVQESNMRGAAGKRAACTQKQLTKHVFSANRF